MRKDLEMITADTLKGMMSFTTKDLAKILDVSGYSMCSFETAKFLGLTNGNQFCYQVTYFDEAGTGENESAKVFVSLDQETGFLSAEF
jgi:hypothetical protein